MDAKVLVSIAGLIRHGLDRDTHAVSAYAKQLSDRLAELGETDAVELITECLLPASKRKVAKVCGSGDVPRDERPSFVERWERVIKSM
jgi:hypothetical protein